MGNKATIIFNSKAAGSRRVGKSWVMEAAKKAGWVGQWVEEGTEEGIGAAASKAVAAQGEVIVAGGDGSVRAAIEAVMGKGTVGIVALGTGNMLAGHLGIAGRSVEEMVRVAMTGLVREIDVGQVNGHYFAVAASVGVTVGAMMAPKKEKRRWGVLAYVVAGLKVVRSRPVRYRITIDGVVRSVRAVGVVVANLGTISGMQIIPGLDSQSGTLGVAVLAPMSLGGWVKLIGRAVIGRTQTDQDYQTYIGRKVIIEMPGKKRRFECDGEILGAVRRLEAGVESKKLKVRVPSQDKIKKPGDRRNLVVFDFDGTLADTQRLLVSIFNHLAPKYGIRQVDPKEAEGLRGLTVAEIVRKLGIKAWKLPGMLVEGKREFRKHVHDVEIFDGLKDELKKMAGKYRLGIVTSNDEENVRVFLGRHQLDVFEFVFSEKDIFGKGKVLKDLMAEKAITPDRVIYVGDEVRDIEAARESGVKAVAVGWGFNSAELLKTHKPDKLIGQVSELEEV